MLSRKELANAIRALSMDAVEKAQSGHPGAPMGMADMAEVLWNDFLKHNPANPQWWNRDRFVLSNGHASMLLYSLLHLSGYDLSIEDLKNFRQLNSKTPGHPEYGLTPGVETTTGPLGQGLANAVGMALAEVLLAAQFNREGLPLVDHYTYVFLGDGCLMEGISHEAASLAGTLGLGKLIALWDDNGISIDGEVKGWFRDDTPARFKAYGWDVITGVDGHNAESVKKALAKARKSAAKPTLICCRTTIGLGAPAKAGKASCHGAPLGADEVAGARKALGWKYDPFVIPGEIKSAWDARRKGKAAETKWLKIKEDYRAAYPDLAKEFERRMKGEFNEGWEEALQAFTAKAQKAAEKRATRVTSLDVLNVLGPHMPELIGGSADLTGSVGTKKAGSVDVKPGEFAGNYISYGVREFAMGAIMNGLALHGGFIPYAGTFLIFSDYAKNAIRMAALMKQRVVWVLTHDSIGVGEDGPTHQPVEQLAGLRYIPGLHVWRPCDAVESAVAWKNALARKNGPTCLALSRQGLSTPARTEKALASIAKGGYILHEPKGGPEAIIIATGSEVEITVTAAQNMEKAGRRVRVVSMPCPELFDAQDAAWKESVLPHKITARLAVEAAAADWWRKYVGLDGKIIGMRGFGESAPGKVLAEYFGFTVGNIVQAVEELLKEN